MPRLSWPVVVLFLAILAALVLLEETGKAVPAWLAGAGGSIVGYVLRWLTPGGGKETP